MRIQKYKKDQRAEHKKMSALIAAVWDLNSVQHKVLKSTRWYFPEVIKRQITYWKLKKK